MATLARHIAELKIAIERLETKAEWIAAGPLEAAVIESAAEAQISLLLLEHLLLSSCRFARNRGIHGVPIAVRVPQDVMDIATYTAEPAIEADDRWYAGRRLLFSDIIKAFGLPESAGILDVGTTDA